MAKSHLKRKSHNGGVAEMQKRVKGHKGRGHVKVGVQEGSGDHKGEGGEGLSVADVASFHEFGTDSVPQRSFIRAPIEANRGTIKDFQALLLREVILGKKTINQALGLIGEHAQADMIAAINSGIEPGLEQSTIDRKGSSTPLIDSGQLKQSIRYKVED